MADKNKIEDKKLSEKAQKRIEEARESDKQFTSEEVRELLEELNDRMDYNEEDLTDIEEV